MIKNWNINLCFKQKLKNLSETHHCDDLKVFKVRPLCCEDFFGDKIGLVSWITLKQKQS